MPKSPLQIPASSLEFLKSLKLNNNREWFNDHKDEFLEQQAYIETFAEGLIAELNTQDVIETLSGKKSLSRIYRDTRFSKEKIPYKHYFNGHFSRSGRHRRGGYYFRIEPGNTFIAGGFQNPNAEDLKRIREEIAADPSALNKIVLGKPFRETFGTLRGEQLKTTPKGFDRDHEAIALLRYKQFLLVRSFTDEEVLSASFVKDAAQVYKRMLPFFDYMSEILSTDINGAGIS
ncbi:MAG: DUF2461 domain-containing protein [Pedobacter sp.]|uniref:DUF2461 domain-containing protein n=1 Tax=Pedobacter sp. TaxID=1411316 RepID=UPI0033947BE6